MNKEAIELLEKARKWILEEGGVVCPHKYGMCKHDNENCPVFCIDQTLAILRTEQLRITDMERRLKAHITGEAVKGFCRKCRKPFWNVDDEDMTCPFCGWKGFPVPDIDAEQIA